MNAYLCTCGNCPVHGSRNVVQDAMLQAQLMQARFMVENMNSQLAIVQQQTAPQIPTVDPGKYYPTSG